MSNLFKKVTSSVAALTVVFSVVSPIAGANAAYTSSIEAANKLAASGVITDKSANPADYRLGDNITRREIVKVAIQLASCQDVTLNTEYKGKFSDVPSTDWAWKYAETAVDNGFIAANAKFDPSRNVSKAEALKMVMNATQVAKADGEANFWDAYVKGAVAAGVTDTFSDYDAAAQRGWIFKAAANALDAGTCGADSGNILDDLLNGIDNTDGTSTGTTTDVSTGSTTTGGTFTVALSPDTAASASIPGGVTGLPVASYDFTAGDSDVTITSITVKRKGLSDKDTLTSLAAFSSDGRASKGKDDSQNDNTEALLTLTNGFVVKAGQTRTLSIVADTAIAATAANDEFAIELVEVVASATAQSDGSLVANTFKIGSVDAPKVYVQSNGNVSNPKLGEEGVDAFKFAVKGASDEDVVVKSITFRADNSNASDDLANFKVYLGSSEVASAAAMNDKYVTFTFGNGLTIAKNKIEKFTVKADVVGGASDIIKFYVDKSLDVTANGTKYGYGAAVDILSADAAGELGSITIQAGELALVDVDAPADKIRENKDDVVFGSVKVTNVAGKNLELQDFGVKIVVTWAPYFDANNDNIQNGGELTVTKISDILENVELYNVDSGASYEIDTDTSAGLTKVYSDTDLGINLPAGTATFQIRADVKENLGGFDATKFNLTLTTGTLSAVTGGFKVVETADDTVVSDITPSSLSWKTVAGTEAGATATVTPLSDLSKVQGSNDVAALQFEVEADQSSAVTLDEIVAKVRSNGNTADATNQQIAQVSLYKGNSISDANLLDRVSGSNLASGSATFDGFEVVIPANTKQSFVVTVSFVDGSNAVTGSTYRVQLTSVSATDDENDDIIVGGVASVISARDITVTNAGTLSINADANNTDNKEDKTVLAGTSKTVFSADVQAQNESADVEIAEFTISQNVKNAVVNASLYLGDTLIATNSNADISSTKVTFKDLTTLIIPTSTKELRLALNTANIGFEEVGETLKNVTVSAVDLKTIEGVDSGKVIADKNLASTSSRNFSIVPATVTPSVTSTLSGGQAKLKITVDAGANKVETSNNTPNVLLTDLKFSELGNNALGYTIYKEGESSRKGTISNTGVFAKGTMDDVLDLTISSDATYVIVPTGTVDKTYTLNLAKDGVVYSVVDSTNTPLTGATGLKSSLTSEVELGTKSY